MIPRIIPILLLKNKGLYKGAKFKDYQYVGDPLNAVKIFNDLECDELIFLDIEASKKNYKIDKQYVQGIADECFMPFCIGGGIDSYEIAAEYFKSGAEKVSLNSYAYINKDLIKSISESYGNQSIVASIDIKKNIFGKYRAFIYSGTKKIDLDPIELAQIYQEQGAGEILLSSIDRDGTYKGYDIELINKLSKHISIPLIVAGGCGNLGHMKEAIENGADSAAAGSVFVFHSSTKGVLINYPTKEELEELFKN